MRITYTHTYAYIAIYTHLTRTHNHIKQATITLQVLIISVLYLAHITYYSLNNTKHEKGIKFYFYYQHVNINFKIENFWTGSRHSRIGELGFR